jgi:hypothetical protein
VKQVNHYIDEIQQDPAPGGKTLDVMRVSARFLQLPQHRVGDAAHMGVRSSRSNHEPVRRIVQSSQVQRDQILRIQVVGGP